MHFTMKNGPILPGDSLTSSDMPGYAVKATKPGPTIAKALEKFDGSKGDRGKILVYVDGGWYGGEQAIAAGEIATSKLAEGVTKAAPEAKPAAAAAPAVQPTAVQTIPIWWLAVVIAAMLAMAGIGYAIGRTRKQ